MLIILRKKMGENKPTQKLIVTYISETTSTVWLIKNCLAKKKKTQNIFEIPQISYFKTPSTQEESLLKKKIGS